MKQYLCRSVSPAVSRRFQIAEETKQRERAGPGVGGWGGRMREGVFDSAPPRGVGLRKPPASYLINSVPQSPRLRKWAQYHTV